MGLEVSEEPVGLPVPTRGENGGDEHTIQTPNGNERNVNSGGIDSYRYT